MTTEQESRSQLIDQLRSLKSACESAIRIAQNRQYIKSNRIHSLQKKRHELTTAYRRSIQCIDSEIQVTRKSQDYPRPLSPRAHDLPR